jgi:energy-converting hydrogenase Eha subunit G
VLAGFPVLEIDHVMRNTLRVSAALTIVGGVATIALGAPLVAPGLLIGLGLAIANHRVFQASAMRLTSDDGHIKKKPFAGSVALRLGACTAVAVVLLVFVRQMGWGVVAALAMFQLVLMGSAMGALLRYQRSQSQVESTNDG